MKRKRYTPGLAVLAVGFMSQTARMAAQLKCARRLESPDGYLSAGAESAGRPERRQDGRVIMRLLSNAVLWLFVAVAAAPVQGADEIATNPTVIPAGRNIGGFLLPDGRIDMEALRRSGYQGMLDLDGFSMRMNPETTEPTVQQSLPKSHSDSPDDIYWDNSTSSSVQATNGYVDALARILHE
jgi:hypothetical protein